MANLTVIATSTTDADVLPFIDLGSSGSTYSGVNDGYRSVYLSSSVKFGNAKYSYAYVSYTLYQPIITVYATEPMAAFLD